MVISRNPPHIGRMAEKHLAVRFSPQPHKIGSSWDVIATLPSGQEERISEFDTEADAERWIAVSSGAWLKVRGLP
jgi:hypothetical protein